MHKKLTFLLVILPGLALLPALAEQGQGVPQRLEAISEQVDTNLGAILDIPDLVVAKIPPPPPPPPPQRLNPAATTWIGLRISARAFQEDSDRPTIIQRESTEISFLNPGNQTATVGCTFFSDNGNLLLGVGGATRVLGPGAKGFCNLLAPVNSSLRGWVLLNSDQPILPDGREVSSINRDRESQVEFYPIDCEEPAGLEYACQFANGGGQDGPF